MRWRKQQQRAQLINNTASPRTIAPAGKRRIQVCGVTPTRTEAAEQ
jgi:hypothetical protein